jgi:phosphatidylglycerol---prolipoprotein diacylglyceryl transferase
MISYITWDIAPEVFEGFIYLRWYGLCWVLGIMAGQQIMVGIYKKEGHAVIELDKLTLYMMLGAVIGARLGHILFYDPIHYLNNPIEILPIKIEPEFQFTGLAGLASHGGILGGLVALYVYHRKFKRGYLWLSDRLIIAGAALGGFIRMGNLMNSEIIGTPSDLPWAFVFIEVDQIPRHPSQLYEAICYFVMSIVLYFVWKSGKFQAPGFIFGLGIVMIFTQRFLMEFIKENQVAFEETLTLNMGQLLSMPLIVGGIALMVWSRRKSSPV